MRCSLWERQGEKTAPSGRNRQSGLFLAPAKPGNNPTTSSDATMVIGPTQASAQTEAHSRGTGNAPSRASYYCGLTIDLPAPDCHNLDHPKPPVAGCATFTITGEPGATIEEEVETFPTEVGKLTWQSIPQVCNLDRMVTKAHLYGCR